MDYSNDLQWHLLRSLSQVEKFCHCMRRGWDLNGMILVALSLHHLLSDFRQDIKEVMTVMMFSNNRDHSLF